MPEFQSFTLQAYTRLTLTARVIVHHATLSSNPAWVEISKKMQQWFEIWINFPCNIIIGTYSRSSDLA